MKEELIKKVQEGTHAIENNGTLEQLNKVLKACFPEDINGHGHEEMPFFARNTRFPSINPLKWLGFTETSLPTIKVTEFFEEHSLESLHERIEDLEITLEYLKSAFLAHQEVHEKKSKKVKKLEKRIDNLEEKLAVINAWNNPTYTVGNLENPLKKEDLRASLEDRVKDLGLKNIEVNRWTEKRNEGLDSFVSVKAYDEYGKEYFIFRHDCKVGENEIIKTLRDKINEKEETFKISDFPTQEIPKDVSIDLTKINEKEKTLEEKLQEITEHEVVLEDREPWVLIRIGEGCVIPFTTIKNSNYEIIEKVKKIIEILK